MVFAAHSAYGDSSRPPDPSVTTEEPGPVVAGSASADPATPRKERLFRFGGGFLMTGGIVATEKPSSGDPAGLYPGYFGSKSGVGVSLEGRVFGALGLQVDILRVSEDATAEINRVKNHLEQTALHVPVYAKGILPFGPVRPFVGFGPEFVFGVTENYTLLGGMLGVEGYIPIKSVVLLIPFGLRYAYNVGMGSTLQDRSETFFGQQTPRPNFQHNAGLTLGVSLLY